MLFKKAENDELVKKANNIKITDASDLTKQSEYNTKINETEKKITDHDHGK